jgi:hypothetical protein
MERVIDAGLASSRSYDTRAQIGSVAYLLVVGVLRFGAEFQPGGPVWRGYATQSLILLAIVLPVLLFGWVLKPKSPHRKSLPSHKAASRGSTTTWFDGRSAEEIVNEIDGVDWRAEYAFEIEKILSIRDQKRIRFLLALYSAGLVVLGFLIQFAMH